MKSLTLLFAVVALSLSIMANAQSSPQQSGNQVDQAKPDNQSTQMNSGSQQKMSGKVSHDGKTVVNDNDNKSYNVNNPGALRDYEDQHVGLIVQVDPDDNAIHIISVAPPQP
jgi:hypothetical protein